MTHVSVYLREETQSLSLSHLSRSIYLRISKDVAADQQPPPLPLSFRSAYIACIKDA